MRKHVILACALAAMTLISCGKKMPKEVIDTNRMENLLYDYHLSSAMQSSAPHNDNVKKEAMRRFIFDKYGVTQEQFDSSMVWYTRHPEHLAKIYSNLKERFSSENDYIAQMISSRGEGMTLSLTGDTVDMWNGDAYLHLLAHQPLHRLLSFTMAADSNFQANDAIRWTADYTFGEDTHAMVKMGMSVIYDNDSVAGEVKNVARSGRKDIYIPQDSAYKIRSIHGFIALPENATVGTDVLVHHFSLMRYHVPVDSTKLQSVKADSLKTEAADSTAHKALKPDTLPVHEPQHRLSPNELKRESKPKKSTTVSRPANNRMVNGGANNHRPVNKAVPVRKTTPVKQTTPVKRN